MPSCRRDRLGRRRRRGPTARAVDPQKAACQLGARILERRALRRQAEDGAAALAADDREHPADARRAPQRRMHVATVAPPAPPQQLVGQTLAQRLVEVVARARPLAQAVVDGLADAVERLHRREAVQRPPGAADHRLGSRLVGRLETRCEDGEILRRDGQRGAADAGDEHELVERCGTDIGARGERQRRGTGRRVLQSHDGGGARPTRIQALDQMLTREAKRERLPARDAHSAAVHRVRACAASRAS